MKINDLKIGDRVKYDFGENTILDVCSCGEGVIENFVAPNNVKLKEFLFDFNVKFIVSKLEPIYKEIPIEKDNSFWAKIEIAQHFEYPTTPTTTYHCPVCDKQLWGTCGMPIKQIANEPCKECKEKSAPKSFKFDFKVQSTECNCDKNGWVSAKMIGFGIFENDRIEMDLVLPYSYDLGDITLGKTYTVEIKEKQ